MRGQQMKTLTTLGIIMSTLGFLHLLDLRDEQPTIGYPLIGAIGVIYLIGVLVEFRNKR
jgi:uncharacterized membrane protein YkvI